MVVFNLFEKEIYVGEDKVNKAYLGSELIYKAKLPPVTPLVSLPSGWDAYVSHDYTTGKELTYALETLNNFTGELTGTKRYGKNWLNTSSGGNTIQTITAGSSVYISYYVSFTFKKDASSGGKFRRSVGRNGYLAVYWYPNTRQIVFSAAATESGYPREVSYNVPVVDGDYVTIDLFVSRTAGANNRFWVNGVNVGDGKPIESERESAKGGTATLSFEPGSGLKLYDVKAFTTLSTGVITQTDIDYNYDNIKQRLATL